MNKEVITIIMFSMSQPDDWRRGVANRNYWMARELSKMENVRLVVVWYLPWDLWTTGQAIKRFVRSWFMPSLKLGDGYVTDISAWWHYFFPWITKWRLRRWLHGSNAVVLDYHPLTVWQRTLGLPIVVDLVDDLAEHGAHASIREKLKKNYRALGTDPLVRGISAVNGEILRRYNLQGVEIRNGYDAEWDVEGDRSANPVLSDVKRPIITYVGTVQERFNMSLLRAIAEAFPNATFAIVGPIWPECVQQAQMLMKESSNIRFLGRMPNVNARRLLAQSDIGIVLHRWDTKSSFLMSTDSMKILEYLAAGLPVITTPEGGTDQYGDIVRIARTEQEWVASLRNVLENPISRELVQSAVRGRSWRAQAERLLQIIRV